MINIDWALLPIGDNYTMGAADAVKACDFINCKNVIGIHYDTFPAIKIDKEETMKKFIAAGLNLKLPAVGESLTL
jgi:L-ascorbate metabolism protein UlaG (beta-lactamase superfamily)